MKAIRLRITDLLEEHGDTFQKCKGCSTCEEIKILRKQLERDPAEKFKHILAKGQDMTRSDIEFLIENEVQRKQIKKALGMHWTEFCEMMKNLKLDKRSEMEVAKLEMTIDEFVKLKYIDKLSIVAIAKLKGVADPTIHHWMKPRKKQIDLAVQSLNLQYKNVADTKPAKEDKTAEYERLIAELRTTLNYRDETIDNQDSIITELSKTIEHYENTSITCDVKNEIDSLREELQKETISKNRAQLEYNRVQSQLEKTDAILEGKKSVISILDKTLQRYQKENKAMRELLALWI